ncbi:formate C-acetyltransferase [Sporobacter termitidis DSM 10068]|uniref:Formate C-acetyltransferase n=1 Tax=Sporobacter termitidis DSM 10068 TaxID=1123282 RepID=A0A1M5XUS3_9FIRM|nr:pyruvate formate lyase family protein [Sporobacter termitidis]SHI03540.1 formate C-acetyltransferase [Sporobacter termitidis DSM 10068]
MMYTLKPMTDRVKRVRERYRSTTPKLCTARLKIVTEFYQENTQLTGILKRAKNFRILCEKLPIHINEDELIVGSQATTYRGSSLNPEFGGIAWFRRDWENGTLLNRPTDNYLIDQEDIDYVLSVVDFWEKENNSAKLSEYVPEGYLKSVGNGVTAFGEKICIMPIGHFCSNYDKVIRRGFGTIRDEARFKMASIEGRLYGEDAAKYTFYRSVVIVSESMITLSKRYAAACMDMARIENDPVRRKELKKMADSLDWIMEKPCRNFHDAVQCLYLYHIGMCLDGQQHGISFGRVDQYLGDYYKADLASGVMTPEEGQEILDLFYLKVAEMNKMGPSTSARGVSGYTSGMLMTLGGVDKNGNDATNDVTYMMLQSAGRLVLHDPPQALRIHRGTPDALWEAAIATTMIAGGVPTFEYDEIIIPGLQGRGLSLESARNYCLIGCVEPAGCGDHWSMCGASGWEGYWNMANCFLQAINNGYNPFPNPDGSAPRQTGLPTGYLYEMESFDQVLEAVRRQMRFFVDWQVSMTNIQEYITDRELPLPLVSAAMDGCMESGKDVMDGGARYNSTGFPGIAIGNLVDCLAVTKYLVYDRKICTARELYDALMTNWDGKEALRQYILNEAPRYGNANDYNDKYLTWVGDTFAEFVNAAYGPRGRFSAGLFPVAFNVLYGLSTAATPDGRKLGEPLSDGISPMQQMDKNGPTAILASVSRLDQSKYPDGTLLNMKFHPTALSAEDSKQKLKALIETYFDMGGMEMQINVISSEILRDAQKAPDKYKNLVVRVAGFSAYFVELVPGSQEDLIRRTELSI